MNKGDTLEEINIFFPTVLAVFKYSMLKIALLSEFPHFIP